jgi:hypothetical protein
MGLSGLNAGFNTGMQVRRRRTQRSAGQRTLHGAQAQHGALDGAPHAHTWSTGWTGAVSDMPIQHGGPVTIQLNWSLRWPGHPPAGRNPRAQFGWAGQPAWPGSALCAFRVVMVCVRLGKAWLPTAGPSRLLKREASGRHLGMCNASYFQYSIPCRNPCMARGCVACVGPASSPVQGPLPCPRPPPCTLKRGRRSAGAAIFFEFKHYKVEKHKWSTKCWAFLEREVRALCPRPAFRLPRARVLPIYAATPPFLLTPYSRLSPPLPALLSA